MTGCNQRLVPKLLFLIFCIFLIPGVSTLLAGCSYQKALDKTTHTVTKTTQKISRGIKFSGVGLKKMVNVSGFENKSLYRAKDFAQLFRKGLPEFLNDKCKGVIVVNSDANGQPEQLKELPTLESGHIDNFALAGIGRELGLNAIVTGSLDDIGVIDEVRGMVWKDRYHLIQILVSVEVYDTETGTKTLDKSFNRKIEIDELDYDLMRSKEKMILPDLNETLIQLITEMGESVCWAVQDQPWNGFILSIAGEKIILSSGSNVGLKLGDVLEVYDNSREMKGIDGQRFFIHGPKIGEIKIVEVEPGSSKAVAESDNGIKTGSSVRLK